MNDKIKDRLCKVLALAEKGATPGEKQAARNAMERLIQKYNLSGEDLDLISYKPYVFKWKMQMEVDLLLRVCKHFTGIVPLLKIYTGARREVHLQLNYLDYVTVSAAYEYFRRHMKEQWNKYCLPTIKRKRKSRSQRETRDALKGPFMSRYFIESGLVDQHEITTVNTRDMSKQEREAFLKTQSVQGGKYNRQLNNGLLLE